MILEFDSLSNFIVSLPVSSVQLTMTCFFFFQGSLLKRERLWEREISEKERIFGKAKKAQACMPQPMSVWGPQGVWQPLWIEALTPSWQQYSTDCDPWKQHPMNHSLPVCDISMHSSRHTLFSQYFSIIHNFSPLELSQASLTSQIPHFFSSLIQTTIDEIFRIPCY